MLYAKVGVYASAPPPSLLSLSPPLCSALSGCNNANVPLLNNNITVIGLGSNVSGYDTKGVTTCVSNGCQIFPNFASLSNNQVGWLVQGYGGLLGGLSGGWLLCMHSF